MSDTFDTTEPTEPTEANTAPDTDAQGTPDAQPSTAPDAAEPAPNAPTQDDSLEPLAGDPPSMDNADTESEADLEKKDDTSASAEDVIASPTETSAMDASTSEASSSDDEGEGAQDAGGAEGTVPFDQGLDASLAPDATFGADSADAEKTTDDLTLGENLGGNEDALGDAGKEDSEQDNEEDAEGDQPIEPARPKFVDIVTGELITSGPGFSFDEDLGDKSLGEASQKAAPTGDKDKAIATFNEAVKSLQAAAAALTSLV